MNEHLMRMKERVTNLSKHPHIHYVMLITDTILNETEEKRKTLRKSSTMSIESITTSLTDIFRFTEYNKSYSYYKDGNTEYVRFEGSLMDQKLKLTLDVFTCYCEPLNENQEPPF